MDSALDYTLPLLGLDVEKVVLFSPASPFRETVSGTQVSYEGNQEGPYYQSHCLVLLPLESKLLAMEN